MCKNKVGSCFLKKKGRELKKWEKFSESGKRSGRLLNSTLNSGQLFGPAKCKRVTEVELQIKIELQVKSH